jgi:hypothetical protein
MIRRVVAAYISTADPHWHSGRSCTYAGGSSLDEFYARAVVGVRSASGYAEVKPLDSDR